MGRIFDMNNKFFRFMSKVADLCILNIICVVCCIPVITAGASITAMYYVTLKMVRNEEAYIVRSFFKSFKQNFKQGFLIELIIGVVAALLIADIRICYMWAKADGGVPIRLLMFAAIGLLLVLSAVALYAFPMLSKFENTVIGILKNALLLCMHHLPQTLIMLFITYGLIVFSINYFTAFIVTIPLILYIDSYVLSRIFLIYVKKSQEENAVKQALEDIENGHQQESSESSESDEEK